MKLESKSIVTQLKCQIYMLLHIFAPLLAAQGVDVGWVPGSVKCECETIKLCNRLVNMAEEDVFRQI